MTTTYTFDQLKDDVRKEAEALRVHATKEELGRLDIIALNPVDERYCIYGLMTTHCHSKRAAELIDTCAIRHFDFLPDNIEDAGDCIVKKRKDFLYQRENQLSKFTFSAIECYIQLPEAKNANLIAFLKGETDKLEL